MKKITARTVCPSPMKAALEDRDTGEIVSVICFAVEELGDAHRFTGVRHVAAELLGWDMRPFEDHALEVPTWKWRLLAVTSVDRKPQKLDLPY